MSFKIKCKHLTEKPFEVEVTGTSTVLEIKEKIAAHLNVPAAQQKVIFKGKFLILLKAGFSRTKTLLVILG